MPPTSAASRSYMRVVRGTKYSGTGKRERLRFSGEHETYRYLCTWSTEHSKLRVRIEHHDVTRQVQRSTRIPVLFSSPKKWYCGTKEHSYDITY